MLNTTIENQHQTIIGEDLHFRLQEEFKLGAAKFADNPLHLMLKQDSIDVKDKLAFIPDMLFFVMGFKDLMHLIRYENPQNELERAVNEHSDNDDYHWKWYLQDLAILSEKFKNQGSIDLICDVWDQSIFEGRNSIYVFSRYMLQFPHPAARMLMVEVLEVGFDIFKDHLHPVLKEAGLFDQLDYFGKKHQEVEENHATGIEDEDIEALIPQLPEDIKGEMVVIINQLFDQIYNMADSWSKKVLTEN